MLLLEVHVNIFLVPVLMIVSAVIAFVIRSGQISSLKGKVNELEKEMLNCHAEILQLQKEKIEILQSVSQPTIPVIPINAQKEDVANKLPDVSTRKKVLGATGPVKQQSGS